MRKQKFRHSKKNQERGEKSAERRTQRAKHVYFFSADHTEGNAAMKNLLGGKGANLAEMARLGFPVPPGFSISTEACTYFFASGHAHPPDFESEVTVHINRVERVLGKKFGDPKNPLLFSVRSGARISMPGMMDTVLNLGLTDITVEGLSRASGSERFAYDSYRRFLQMFGNVVMGLEKDELEGVLEAKKRERGITRDDELDAADLRDVAERLKNRIEDLSGVSVPQDPLDQLWHAIDAVFKSWNTPRAITYRKIHKIPDEWGTAVTVQSMVFGNFGDDSGTGVCFSRNPATGEDTLYGEFLKNAQGEDVVAGIRTPKSIAELTHVFPECFVELRDIAKKLERHFRDLQDIEFTIERGKLWILQVRGGKRTPRAAVKIAVDLEKERLISKDEALLRVDPQSVEILFKPAFDPDVLRERFSKGLPASPGAAVGEVVFDPDEARSLSDDGHRVILVRTETSPDDIGGIAAAEGIVTSRGGMTSHAALVARGMGKPCVVGCEELMVSYRDEELRVGERVVKRGEWISIDGATGEVFFGKVPLVDSPVPEDLTLILSWADERRTLGVMANADTPEQARKARELGAEGIGLCRTEHMFFAEDRLPLFQQVILARDEKERRAALGGIKPLQKDDFIEIFRVMESLPVIIRFLDPPLHEFLPRDAKEIGELARELGIAPEEIQKKVEDLREANPMLGHRGSRLGLTYPEIYEMQAEAVLEAAAELTRNGVSVIPKIMLPLIMSVGEFTLLEQRVREVARRVFREQKTSVPYTIGTMIEVPRACLRAGEIAKAAEFFSFGTNDLTQTTFGLSRDDSMRFLKDYLEKKIFGEDPFVSIDRYAVGELIKIGRDRGKETRPDLEVGICGEHGGDPASIEFCHEIRLDYVSCSPFRVPVARLAAAQAALRQETSEKGEAE